MISQGRYIYAIVELWKKNSNERPKSYGNIGIGDSHPEVYLIENGKIGAFVSDSPVVTYQLSRENMLTHERIIEKIMNDYTILPMQFSTVSENDAMIHALIEKEREVFSTELEKLLGKREMGLKAIFHEKIYDDIASTDNAVIKLKAEAQRYGASQALLIEVGKAVESALINEKNRCKEDILATLSPLAIETVEGKLIGERMLLNAAFLIDDLKESDFDDAVNLVGNRYSERMKFKYVGNAPAYNFVRLTIKLNSN
ncbi:MAG: GvpL/GvpF family gas vesicle protein [Chloroherpetonaceae bacterium]|nr:GvpL/GvpF family gas vesicle protein [Chloroherpetonaceae bacterium]